MWWKLLALTASAQLAPDKDGTGGDSGSENTDDGGDGGDDDFLSLDGGDDDDSGLMAARDSERKKKKTDADSAPDPKKQGDKKTKGVARPDYIEEKYWDSEKGEPRIEALAKANKDLFTQAQTLRAQKNVPATPDGYLSAAFDTEGKLKLQADIPNLPAIAKDDPVLSAYAESAHKRGLTQDQFNGIMQDVLQISAENAPPPFDKEAYVAEQKAILGPNADALVDHSIDWIKSLVVQGTLSAEQGKALYDGVGRSAHGILALQKLYTEITGEFGIPTDVPLPERGVPTPEEWYDMKLSQKYKTDEAYKKEVDDLAEVVFPGKGGANLNLGRLGMSRLAQRDGQARMERRQNAMRPGAKRKS